LGSDDETNEEQEALAANIEMAQQQLVVDNKESADRLEIDCDVKDGIQAIIDEEQDDDDDDDDDDDEDQNPDNKNNLGENAIDDEDLEKVCKLVKPKTSVIQVPGLKCHEITDRITRRWKKQKQNVQSVQDIPVASATIPTAHGVFQCMKCHFIGRVPLITIDAIPFYREMRSQWP